MLSNLNNLYKLTKNDVQRASEVLARAFEDDPVWNRVLEDEKEKFEKFCIALGVPVRYSLKYGVVYTTSVNLEGIAAWIPSDKANMTLWGIVRSGAFRNAMKLGSNLGNKINKVFKQIEEDRKEYMKDSFLYLIIIGVEPEYQGKGFGSKLLRPMIDFSDDNDTSIYLETETEKNVKIYEKYGFEVIKEIELDIINVPMWEMVREPTK